MKALRRSDIVDMEDAAAKPPEPEHSNSEDKKGIVTWVRKLLPVKNAQTADDSLREAIEELIEEKEESASAESAVARHERKLISNILQLRDLPVAKVMVPRADIVAIDITTSREELIRLMAEKPHSRIPVYKGDLDNIVGFVHIKDIVANVADGNPFELKDILRDVLVVSPSMRVLDLLLQLRQSKVHIAFVVDEFGGIDGLLTIGDLIEAIVGEIGDEYDFEIDPQLIERADGSAIADARYPIKSFEAKYGDLFSEDEEDADIDTLGGLVTALAGHVPSRGEVVRHSSGIEFEVLDADPRRVTRLRIRPMPKKEEAAKAE